MRPAVLVFGLLSLLAPAMAEARPRVRAVVPVPGIRVVINPWAPGYAPAPRPGWVWVEGHYDEDGNWIPGYWRPAFDRPGYVWVPGHWNGAVYVDGYWREADRPGFVWVEGHYEGNRWVPGYWAPAPPPAPPPPPEGEGEVPVIPAPGDVHHDYE